MIFETLSDLEILLIKIKSENAKLVELGSKSNEENGWNYKTADNTGKILRGRLRSNHGFTDRLVLDWTS